MDEIKTILEANSGYIKSSQLTSRAQYYQLTKMVNSGELIKVKRGLYRLATISEGDNWATLCHIIPSGVLCMFSAWQFYQLTTHISSFVHIAVQRKQKLVLPDYPPVKLYYWSSKYKTLGSTEVKQNDEKISMYDIEKSVCDAVKFRNKIGIDITSEVLKNYLKRKDRNLDKLMKYANVMRISEAMQNYLNIIV